jgi:hypothetical protein
VLHGDASKDDELGDVCCPRLLPARGCQGVRSTLSGGHFDAWVALLDGRKESSCQLDTLIARRLEAGSTLCEVASARLAS